MDPTDKDGADIQEALAKAQEEAARAAEANACFSSELGEPAAANNADYMRYTDFLRRNMEKPHVVDGDLAHIIDEQFRDNAKVGNGSTAAAVREETRSASQ